MENVGTGSLDDIAQDHVIQREQSTLQGCSFNSENESHLRRRYDDHPSRTTPPPPGTSSSTEEWRGETRQGASTPPPPLDTTPYSSPTRSRNSLPDPAKPPSLSSHSGVKDRIWSSRSPDGTLPGPTEPIPSSNFDTSPLKERQISGTPSPGQSLTGSLATNNPKRQDEIAYPYVQTSPILSSAPGKRTPPPETDGPKYSGDLERGEKRGVNSTTQVNAADTAFDEILQLPTEDRVRAVASGNLVYKRKADGALAINFATLQRIRLQILQSEIVKHALDMRYHGNSNSGWEESLKTYSQ